MKSQPLHVAVRNSTANITSNTHYVQIYVQKSSFLTLQKALKEKALIV